MPQGTTSLAQLFAARAKALKLSNPALAKRAGVEYRLVLRLMKGETVPHEFSVKVIADALGIPEAAWRPAMIASRAERTEEAQDPCYQYATEFIEAHQYIRPPALSQTNKEVRVRLSEVYVSLSAETETDRRYREENELEFDLRGEDDEPDPAGRGGRKKPDERHASALRRVSSAPRILELSAVLAGNPISVILGHPGAGKTTLLKYAGVLHAEALQTGAVRASDSAARNYGSTRLPVYVRVADYAENGRGRTLLDFVRATVATPKDPDTGALFDTKWRREGVLILLDGLDEITAPEQRRGINAAIEALMAECRRIGNQLVVSSRIHGYHVDPLEGAPVFAIREMDREQVSRFFRSWCVAIEREIGSARAEAAGERRAESILRAIDTNTGVRGLAVNPLLCVLIALIQQANVVLPERRVVLMQKAVEALLRVWRIGQMSAADSTVGRCVISAEEESHVLRPLALWLHENKPTGVCSEEELADQIACGLAAMRGRPPGFVEGRQVEEFLSRVRNHSGILIERGQGHYGFLHLLFEEYLAGLQLVDDPDQSIEFIRAHRHQPRWEEPIRLGIASLPKGHAARLIRQGILNPPSAYEDVLYRDLCLAARCLGDCEAVDPGLAVEIAERIVGAILDPAHGVAITPLRESLSRSAHGLTLHQASSAVLIDLLLSALKDKDPFGDVREAAAGALGSLGVSSSDVVAGLLSALQDQDKDEYRFVREAAAGALGSLGISSPEVVTGLLSALQDENWAVRCAAASALGSLGVGSSDVVAGLLSALQDQDQDELGFVREAAAGALGSLGISSPEVVTGLLSALQVKHLWDVRAAAAGALGSLGASSSEVVSALLSVLQDQHEDVCRAVAGALGSLGVSSSAMVRGLLSAPKDQDWNVRSAAATALGSLGVSSSEVVSALLSVLQDEESFVRFAAAGALGSLGVSSLDVVSALLSALKDNDQFMSVRAAAASALGSLGVSSSEVVSALLSALKDNDLFWDVRAGAARALGSLGVSSSEVVSALLSALKDQDNDQFGAVCAGAARALGSLGVSSSEVVSALLSALKDEKSVVRRAAASALGSIGIGSSEVVSGLLSFLQDEDWPVRSAAWEALRDLASHSARA